MARYPIANDGGKLSNLDIQSAIFPGREPDGIFVHADFGLLRSRIEAAIDACLCERVKVRADLRVEE